MATGLAKGLFAKGKLAAFGDGKRIIWGPWSEEMFRNNPNIAKPDTKQNNLQWIAHYKGNRIYNRHDNGRWKWNYDFKAVPGEFYFDPAEAKLAAPSLRDFIVMEPNVPWQKKVAGNKDWGANNYEIVADVLQKSGYRIVQFVHKNTRRKLPNAVFLDFPQFREAISVLSKASLYIGPEGGLHHAAAAVGVKAVVIMGGFIPPQVVGYDTHINLTGGVEACGNIEPCVHCHNAMKNISPDQVIEAVNRIAESEAA